MIRPPAPPCSRSSAVTTSTLAHAGRSTTSARAPDARTRASPRAIASPSASSVANSASSPRAAIFDDLAQGGPPLALRQRRQRREVEHDRRRLVERAQQVLALREVDAGLAADGRVDLGDERRRHTDPGHAPEVRRGQEPRRVAERPAADRDQRVAPLDAQAGELARRLADDRELLRRLARRAASPRRPASRAPAAPRRRPPRTPTMRRAPRRAPLAGPRGGGARRSRRRPRCPRRDRPRRSASTRGGASWPPARPPRPAARRPR